MDGGKFDIELRDGTHQVIDMKGVEEGIVGIITNHSYLDNPTFKGMRFSLMRSFDQIWVLDLHSNLNKKKRAPDRSADSSRRSSSA